MKKFIVLCSLLLVIAGCATQQMPQTSNDQQATTQKDSATEAKIDVTKQEPSNKIGDLWGIKVGYEFPEKFIKKENGPESYVFGYVNNPESNIWTYRITVFDKKDVDLAEYSMSSDLRAKLYDAEGACSTLSSQPKTTFLPIDVSLPFICDSQKVIGENLTELFIIGVQHNYESLPTLGNLLMVVSNNDVVLLQNLVPKSYLADFSANLEKTKGDFIAKNPSVEFPNEAWVKLETSMMDEVKKAIRTNGEELKKSMNFLVKVGDTVVNKINVQNTFAPKEDYLESANLVIDGKTAADVMLDKYRYTEVLKTVGDKVLISYKPTVMDSPIIYPSDTINFSAIYDLNTSKLTKVINSFNDKLPVLDISPNGKKLLVKEFQEGVQALKVIDADGFGNAFTINDFDVSKNNYLGEARFIDDENVAYSFITFVDDAFPFKLSSNGIMQYNLVSGESGNVASSTTKVLHITGVENGKVQYMEKDL